MAQNIEKELEKSMLRFHHKLKDEMGKIAKKLGFSTSQLEVFLYILEKGSITMKDIALKLRITPPSVTSIIDDLYTKGLIRKELDIKDKRITKIVATSKLLKIFNAMKNKKLIILKGLFSKLSIEDKKNLIKILDTITKE